MSLLEEDDFELDHILERVDIDTDLEALPGRRLGRLPGLICVDVPSTIGTTSKPGLALHGGSEGELMPGSGPL